MISAYLLAIISGCLGGIMMNTVNQYFTLIQWMILFSEINFCSVMVVRNWIKHHSKKED